MTNSDKKVVVAMSGGVDSSVTALLLMEQGYEVIGFTGNMHPGCDDAIAKAQAVCGKLGIPHDVLDLREEFKNSVINYFETSYRQGLTPNPCTFCNRTIKWGVMTDYVFNELGADLYATGHYSKIRKVDGHYRIYRADDPKKDQTYMLCGLTQDDLARTIFPLGDMQKFEIMAIAEKHGLVSSGQKESQDVCFITPPETNSSYLIKRFGEQEGDIVEHGTGKVLGTHRGTFNYTIGQRKGICISAPEALYVTKLEPKQNRVYVGYKKDLFSSEFSVTGVNWQQPVEAESLNAMVKIRYNSPAQAAEIVKTGENTVNIRFEEPKDAITPGQIAVFYDLSNKYLLGGGVIALQ